MKKRLSLTFIILGILFSTCFVQAVQAKDQNKLYILTNQNEPLYLYKKKSATSLTGIKENNLNGHIVTRNVSMINMGYYTTNLHGNYLISSKNFSEKKIKQVFLDDATAKIYNDQNKNVVSKPFFDQILTVKNIKNDQIYFSTKNDQKIYHATSYNFKLYQGEKITPYLQLNKHPLSRHNGYIYYTIENGNDKEAIKNAIKIWNNAGAEFKETTDVNQAVLNFKTGHYQEKWLGQTSFSMSSMTTATIYINLNMRQESKKKYTYQNVVLHELGHALGLNHNMIGTTMTAETDHYGDYTPRQLSWIDIENMKQSFQYSTHY